MSERTVNYDLLGMFAARLPPRGDMFAGRQDLTGAWRCNDNGIYYIRQIGPDVAWYGEPCANFPSFANVAHGTIDEHGIIRLTWADVPKAGGCKCGALVLRLHRDDFMVATRVSGGFTGSAWRR